MHQSVSALLIGSDAADNELTFDHARALHHYGLPLRRFDPHDHAVRLRLDVAGRIDIIHLGRYGFFLDLDGSIGACQIHRHPTDLMPLDHHIAREPLCVQRRLECSDIESVLPQYVVHLRTAEGLEPRDIDAPDEQRHHKDRQDKRACPDQNADALPITVQHCRQAVFFDDLQSNARAARQGSYFAVIRTVHTGGEAILRSVNIPYSHPVPRGNVDETFGIFAADRECDRAARHTQ